MGDIINICSTMKFQDFKKLNDDEIYSRFTARNSWPVDELILLLFGLEYQNIKFDKNGNGFPVRNYEAVMSAINLGLIPIVTEYFSKDDGRKEYIIKKSALFSWAFNEWSIDEDENLKRVYNIWKKFLNSKGKKVILSGSNAAQIQNRCKELQLEEFKSFCKTNKAESYKGNKQKIAKQIMLELSLPGPKGLGKLDYNTYYRQCRLLTVNELKKMLES